MVSYNTIRHDQAGGGGEFVVRNFVGVISDISVQASTVETDLFPKGALDYYTAKNMGWDYTQEDYDMWQLAERGGAQGDYRDGMAEKMANVIDCLKTEPLSKRSPIQHQDRPPSIGRTKDRTSAAGSCTFIWRITSSSAPESCGCKTPTFSSRTFISLRPSSNTWRRS
jgi:hypothetical protein